MTTRQSNLVLKLLDQVTGPARLVGRSLVGLQANLHAFRRSAAGLVLPGAMMGMAAKSVIDESLDLARTRNELEAFGKLHEDQVGAMVDRARDLDALLPVSSLDILKAGRELLKGGLDFRQAMASLPAAARLDVLAGDSLDATQSAVLLTDALFQLRLVSDDANATMANSERLLDLLAFAGANSATTIDQLFATSRFAGPALAALQSPLEDVTALFMGMAQAGYRGSEGGTALRAAVAKMVTPTKKAREALARLGIDRDRFFAPGDKPADASSIIDSLVPSGIPASKLKPFAAEIDRILAHGLDLENTQAAITDLLAGAIGDGDVLDRDALADSIATALAAGNGAKGDLLGFLKELATSGAGIADFNAIFGERQGVRLYGAAFADMERFRAEAAATTGEATRQTDVLVKGWVGAWERMTAAVSKFKQALGDSGFMDSIASGAEAATKWMNRLAENSPDLLKLAGHGMLAGAALGALGLVLPAVVSGASALAAALGIVLNPLAWIVAGVGALAYLFKAELWAGAKGIFEGFTDGLDPAAIERISAAIGALRSGFEWLMGATSAETDASLASWTNYGRAIGNALAMPVNYLLVDLPNAFAQVGQAILDSHVQAKGFVDGLEAAFADGATALYQAGVDFVQGLWDGIKAKWAEFIDWVKMLPGQIAAAFKGLAINIPIAGKVGQFLGLGNNAPAPAVGDFSEVQARATGGPIRMGKLYLAGEEGPEIFRAGRSGTMHDAGATRAMLGRGAPVTINASFHVAASTPEAFARKAFRELESMLLDSRQLSFEGRPVTT